MSTEKTDVEGGPRLTATDNKAPDRPADYFNYHPPISLILLEFLVLLFLGFVCFLPPSGSGGLSSIVRSETEFIGVLKTCSDTTCQAYMAASSTSSAISSTSSDSTKRSSSSLSARDTSLSSSIGVSNLFLTTGLAALASFWLMLYLFLLSSYRYLTSPPPSEEEEEDHKPRHFWDIRDGLKRYAYRVCRIYVVVQSILVLGVACAAAWSFNQGREAGGSLGMGILLLHASWPILFYCAFIELSRGRWRKRIDLGWCGCTCLALFGRSKRRAQSKWGTEEKKASPEQNESRGRSRSRGRSAGRNR